jgi:hypothetical protein
VTIYKTIFLPAVLYACEDWSLILMEEQTEDISEEEVEKNIWTKEG